MLPSLLYHKHRIHDIIEEFIRCDVILIPHDIVTEFKYLLRGNDTLIEFCFGALFDKLISDHPQTRLLALFLIDCVFRRSKRFRELTVDKLELLFEATLPINSQNPLPKPRKTAQYLSEQSIEFIEEWTEDFGSFYFRLKLGYQHLAKNHGILFPHKRMHEKEKQKLKQMNEINQIKQKLQKFIEIIDKFKQKCPKILVFLHKFESKIDEITPSFDKLLQKEAPNQSNCIGFSDDDSEGEEENKNDDDNDLALQIPSFSKNGFCDNDDDLVEDDAFMQELDFLSNCRRYGLQKGYSLKITINTDIDSYLKSKQQDNKQQKHLLKEISTYRYLMETKLNQQIEEWRTVLIDANLNVISNADKQLLLANKRMEMLRQLDQMNGRMNAIISRCDALKIAAKNKQKRKCKKITKCVKETPKLAAKYVDVKTSLRLSNRKLIHLKQKRSPHRTVQKQRILFKKLSHKRKAKTFAKFGVGSKFPKK